MKKKILITGICGEYGSKFASFLNPEQYEIYGIDDMSNKNSESRLEYIKSITKEMYYDLIEFFPAINKIFSDIKLDIVLHFAAKTGIEASFVNPVEFYKTNIIGIENLLKASLSHNVKKFINISDCDLSENEKNKFNPYFISKKTAELIVEVYFQKYNLNCFSLQFKNEVFTKTVLLEILEKTNAK